MAEIGVRARTIDNADLRMGREKIELVGLEVIAVDHERVFQLRERTKIIERPRSCGNRLRVPNSEPAEHLHKLSRPLREQLQFGFRFREMDCQGSLVRTGQINQALEEFGMDAVRRVRTQPTDESLRGQFRRAGEMRTGDLQLLRFAGGWQAEEFAKDHGTAIARTHPFRVPLRGGDFSHERRAGFTTLLITAGNRQTGIRGFAPTMRDERTDPSGKWSCGTDR